MDNTYEYNVFIFNWVENYNAKIHHLKESFEMFNNNVEVFNQLTYKELENVVEKLRRANFYLYDYISIIILDNRTKNENLIVTSDGVEVLLHSEILTLLQTNKTLKNKRRLFVIQKLLDLSDLDDLDDDDDDGEDNDEEIKKISRRSNIVSLIRSHKKIKTLYQGLTIAIKSKEFSNDFQNSPFIEVFCKEFKTNAGQQPIDQIYNRILKNIRTNYKRKMNDISFETNQTANDSLIFGSALNSDELRDFV